MQTRTFVVGLNQNFTLPYADSKWNTETFYGPTNTSVGNHYIFALWTYPANTLSYIMYAIDDGELLDNKVSAKFFNFALTSTFTGQAMSAHVCQVGTNITYNMAFNFFHNNGDMLAEDFFVVGNQTCLTLSISLYVGNFGTFVLAQNFTLTPDSFSYLSITGVVGSTTDVIQIGSSASLPTLPACTETSYPTPPPATSSKTTPKPTVKAPSLGISTKCFIATAAFESPSHPSVWALRTFRDEYLSKTSLGNLFIEYYYSYSPPIADLIAESEFAKFVVRAILTPIVFIVQNIF